MTDERRTISVSDAMAMAKVALERVQVRVVGEVSECTVKPGYKAVYFTLRDEGAAMPCLMWRDAYASCGAELRAGQLVEVGGTFTAYPPKGRMQFLVRSLALAGEGALRMQVAALARQLEREGLMRPDRKRPLPPFPQRIGLVTSPRGKAVHDVIRTLRRRYPYAELCIAGVRVEGDAAPAAIVSGLETLYRHEGIDVIILGRGGGSYEDLMPFNAEEVARAVVASPVPVVTGIGHEPDTTIADMVSDLRASTPTAAAEAVAPSTEEIEGRLRSQARLLARALRHTIRDGEHRVRALAQRHVLRDVSGVLAVPAQRLDAARADLLRAGPRLIEEAGERMARSQDGMRRAAAHVLPRHGSALALARERLLDEGERFTKSFERQVGLEAARLEDLSPLGILSRGYAVCYDETGERIVRDAGSVGPGARVGVRLARGSLGCLVEEIRTEE